MKVFAVVALVGDLPEEGLQSGAEGTVVEVFDRPEPAYEVEFADSDGVARALVVLRPDQLRQSTSTAACAN